MEHANRSPVWPGATLWLTGLPSAGKTTVAGGLASRLRTMRLPCEVLDGDVVRQHLAQDLGYSRADRDSNVRRVGWVARLLASHGVIAIVAVIAPYSAARDAVRAYHEVKGVDFFEIHVATPFEVCAQRDVKGLYARARAGEITGLTGFDDPYEPPVSPELRLDTSGETVDDSVDQVFELLRRRHLECSHPEAAHKGALFMGNPLTSAFS